MKRKPPREFGIGLARAFGGAIFFALPLLMTMEMWWLGFYMDRVRLALFLVIFIPVLVGLSHYAGFEETDRWSDDIRDAFVALFVGFVTSAVMLTLGGILEPGVPLRETVGQITIEAPPRRGSSCDPGRAYPAQTRAERGRPTGAASGAVDLGMGRSRDWRRTGRGGGRVHGVRGGDAEPTPHPEAGDSDRHGRRISRWLRRRVSRNQLRRRDRGERAGAGRAPK